MVVEGLLAPYHSNTERLRLSGPAVELESKQALSLLMAIHELATNAVTHGVLSWDEGYVPILGFRRGGVLLLLAGKRRPNRHRADQEGFGSHMIEILLAHDFGGVTKLAYETSGLERGDVLFREMPRPRACWLRTGALTSTGPSRSHPDHVGLNRQNPELTSSAM
jgi:two-component sensor histidine kinase